jgi:parallel beta-helix repeat protein
MRTSSNALPRRNFLLEKAVPFGGVGALLASSEDAHAALADVRKDTEQLGCAISSNTFRINNVRCFGAKGDGVADDTRALLRGNATGGPPQVLVIGNSIQDTHNVGNIKGTGIEIAAMDAPRLVNNRISSTQGPGIDVKDSMNPLLRDNVIESSQDNGITLENTSDAALTGERTDRKKFAVYKSALNNIQVGPNAVRTTITDGTIASAARAGVFGGGGRCEYSDPAYCFQEQHARRCH